MSLERYRHAVQEIHREITYWSQKTTENPTLATLQKISQNLDKLNRKTLPLSEFHTVKALYKEAHDWALKLNSSSSNESKSIIDRLLKKAPDFSQMNTVDQIQKIKNSNLRTLAYLELLEQESNPTTIKTIAKKISNSKIRNKLLRELKKKTSFQLSNVIVLASNPLKNRGRHYYLIAENGILYTKQVSISERFWRSIAGHFTPTCSLTDICAKRSLSALTQAQVLNLNNHQFTYLKQFIKPNEIERLETSFKNQKEIAIKAFLKEEGCNEDLAPFLKSCYDRAHPPRHIQFIKTLITAWSKQEPCPEELLKMLLTDPQLALFLHKVNLSEDPEKALIGLNIYLGKETKMPNTASYEDREKYFACAALGGHKNFLEKNLPERLENPDPLFMYSAVKGHQELFHWLETKYPSVQVYPFARYAALGGHEKLTHYLVEKNTAIHKRKFLFDVLLHAGQSGQKHFFKNLQSNYFNRYALNWVRTFPLNLTLCDLCYPSISLEKENDFCRLYANTFVPKELESSLCYCKKEAFSNRPLSLIKAVKSKNYAYVKHLLATGWIDLTQKEYFFCRQDKWFIDLLIQENLLSRQPHILDLKCQILSQIEKNAPEYCKELSKNPLFKKDKNSNPPTNLLVPIPTEQCLSYLKEKQIPIAPGAKQAIPPLWRSDIPDPPEGYSWEDLKKIAAKQEDPSLGSKLQTLHLRLQYGDLSLTGISKKCIGHLLHIAETNPDKKDLIYHTLAEHQGHCSGVKEEFELLYRKVSQNSACEDLDSTLEDLCYTCRENFLETFMRRHNITDMHLSLDFRIVATQEIGIQPPFHQEEQLGGLDNWRGPVWLGFTKQETNLIGRLKTEFLTTGLYEQISTLYEKLKKEKSPLATYHDLLTNKPSRANKEKIENLKTHPLFSSVVAQCAESIHTRFYDPSKQKALLNQMPSLKEVSQEAIEQFLQTTSDFVSILFDTKLEPSWKKDLALLLLQEVEEQAHFNTVFLHLYSENKKFLDPHLQLCQKKALQELTTEKKKHWEEKIPAIVGLSLLEIQNHIQTACFDHKNSFLDPISQALRQAFIVPLIQSLCSNEKRDLVVDQDMADLVFEDMIQMPTFLEIFPSLQTEVENIQTKPAAEFLNEDGWPQEKLQKRLSSHPTAQSFFNLPSDSQKADLLELSSQINELAANELEELKTALQKIPLDKYKNLLTFSSIKQIRESVPTSKHQQSHENLCHILNEGPINSLEELQKKIEKINPKSPFQAKVVALVKQLRSCSDCKALKEKLQEIIDGREGPPAEPDIVTPLLDSIKQEPSTEDVCSALKKGLPALKFIDQEASAIQEILQEYKKNAQSLIAKHKNSLTISEDTKPFFEDAFNQEYSDLKGLADSLDPRTKNPETSCLRQYLLYPLVRELLRPEHIIEYLKRKQLLE